MASALRSTRRSVRDRLFLLLVVGAISACTTSPAPTPSPSTSAPTTAVQLLAVPFTLTFPAKLAAQVTVQPLTGGVVDEYLPISAAQLNFVDRSGQASFLANAYWFEAARYDELVKPTEPPPGTEMVRTGGRVLALAITVEMPFDPASAEGVDYGAISEILRKKSSYQAFACPVYGELPTQPLADDVRAAVAAYYDDQDLGPVSFSKEEQTPLDVRAWSVGEHSCFNPDGPEAAYTGSVPVGATEAVMVFATHRPYPVTQAPSHFVTLARSGSAAWSVVAEGTGP